MAQQPLALFTADLPHGGRDRGTEEGGRPLSGGILSTAEPLAVYLMCVKRLFCLWGEYCVCALVLCFVLTLFYFLLPSLFVDLMLARWV